MAEHPPGAGSEPPGARAASAAAPGASALRWAPVAALALGALYVVTRSRIHTWDAIAYAARASNDPLLADRYLSTALFHPHHLLYSPLAVAAHRALAPLGLTRDPVVPLQLMSAAFGALSAWLAGLLARRLGAEPRLALGVTIAVGVSNAVWRFSTEALVMVPSLAFLLLGAWMAAGARSRAGWLGAGMGFAGAMLIHQSAVVFAAAATLALWLAGRAGRLVPGAPLAFAIGWAVPAGLAYLAVGIAETGGASPGALAGWMFTAGHRSTSMLATPAGVLRETAIGLTEAWVTLAPLREPRDLGGAGLRFGPAALATLLGAAGAAAAALAALPGLARAVRSREPVVTMLLAGGLATVGLVAAFQPWNHAYWVYLPPLGVAIVAAHLPRLPAWARAAAFLAVAAVATVNLFARALPAMDADRAPYADLIAFSREHFAPGDRLVCGGSASPIGEGVIALPFFARVPVVLTPTPGRPEQVTRFERLVDEAFSAAAPGHGVYVTADAVAPLRRARPGIAIRAVGTVRGIEIYRVTPTPTPIPRSP